MLSHFGIGCVIDIEGSEDPICRRGLAVVIPQEDTGCTTTRVRSASLGGSCLLFPSLQQDWPSNSDPILNIPAEIGC
jgi:hypothetical protein